MDSGNWGTCSNFFFNFPSIYLLCSCVNIICKSFQNSTSSSLPKSIYVYGNDQILSFIQINEFGTKKKHFLLLNSVCI